MKRIVALLLVVVSLFTISVSLADTVEVPMDSQGIVNSVLYKQFGRKMDKLFSSEMGPALAVGMTVAQIETLNSKFHFNFKKNKESIAYIGLASKDSKILFMGLMDKSKKFLLVSIIPAKDYMAYESTMISRKEAVAFIEEYCGTNYVEISYDLMKEADDIVGSY